MRGVLSLRILLIRRGSDVYSTILEISGIVHYPTLWANKCHFIEGKGSMCLEVNSDEQVYHYSSFRHCVRDNK